MNRHKYHSPAQKVERTTKGSSKAEVGIARSLGFSDLVAQDATHSAAHTSGSSPGSTRTFNTLELLRWRSHMSNEFAFYRLSIFPGSEANTGTKPYDTVFRHAASFVVCICMCVCVHEPCPGRPSGRYRSVGRRAVWTGDTLNVF